MTTEDNYNAPNRSIADWIAEGYTKPYAQALFAHSYKLKIFQLIDELNQYLEGNVTLEAATDATKFVIIAASW